MKMTAELAVIARHAECVATAVEIDRALDTMAADLVGLFSDAPIVVLCVMNGGLLVTAELLKRIEEPLTVDYIHATRYRDQTQGEDIQWRALPQRVLTGHQVVVVDDIFDEGPTLAAIANYCAAQGAQRVTSVVLAEKLHDRKVRGFRPDIVGLQLPDRYLFGFGMDYKGYFRNRSMIYAMAEQ